MVTACICIDFLVVCLSELVLEVAFSLHKLKSSYSFSLLLQSISGSLMDAPANSPHLRKPGSRAVVSDFGTFEPDSAFEEALLHSIEVNEMNGVSAPSSTTAILPSPVLLWRLKVFLFLIWGVSCCKISWDSVMRMSVNLRDLFLYEAFLYYNPLLLVTLLVWFWGMNLWVFAQANVDFAKIFDLDQNHLTQREIWKVLLYAAFAMALIFPFDIFYLSSRYFLLRTLWRIAFPLQESFHYWNICNEQCADLEIAFADFFLADILTSMSKVFSDLERSVCRMVHRQVATIAWFEADSVCGSHSVAIPIVLVLPYLFRLFQCLRQYKDTRDRTTLFNALKYSTAVPVIFLSALKYHVFPDNWINLYRPLWLLSAVVNSLYSFYWDLTRDWDLSCTSGLLCLPGVLLGDRKQPNIAMHMDIQAVCPSPTQLPNSVHNNCFRDLPSFPVGFLPCRESVE
ncbi:hypothetical protein RND71_038322 [Anisodus tanguticus]|uniref:EXS domain-containing protein n=1 Tax=Anisodus tanguticus TaxID=243964 RepID=A0AAE1UWW8_9SOLA|nr:hypothetical protein RND71_038322 [Anisodus tanguticus]